MPPGRLLSSSTRCQFFRRKAHTPQGAEKCFPLWNFAPFLCFLICGEHGQEGREPLIYLHVRSLRRATGAFSYLIINVLNQMVPGTVTSVTPNESAQQPLWQD